MAFEVIKGLLSGEGLNDAVYQAANEFSRAFGRAFNAVIGEIKIPEVTIGGQKIAGVEIPEVTIGGQTLGGGGGGDDGGSGGFLGGGPDTLAGNQVASEDVTGGFGVAKDVAGEAASKAGFSAPGGAGVEYNEGNVQNNYHQNISAKPEDKSMLSRTVKDAMEEANSFARQQQGGQ